MLSIDLFDSKYERELREGAVDDLEARRIDDLNMRMLDLLDRAREAKTPEHKAGLKREFDKVKDERDGYYKVREAGIPGNVPTEKIPGKEELLKGRGRTYYEGEEGEWSKEGPWTKTPKNKAGRPVDPRGEVAHLSDVARRKAERDANMRLQIKREIAADRIQNKIQNAITQKKNSEPVNEHGGGIGPRQHWQDLMQETVTDVRPLWADVYRRLAPRIERHRDSFLAGQLYDELENIAELHGAEREFKQMMNGARNRAHMEYDTNPGGFQNWFWFLPFEDNDVEEAISKKDLLGRLQKDLPKVTDPKNKDAKSVVWTGPGKDDYVTRVIKATVCQPTSKNVLASVQIRKRV
jgi:hypothetical protein